MENVDLNLTEFTPDNCIGTRGRVQKAKFSINTKSGLISFNKELIAQLDLDEGSHVIFHQNKNKPRDWYIEVGMAGGFELRFSANKKCLNFNNTSLARKILSSVDFNELYGSCGVSTTRISSGDKVLYAVITAMLREQTNVNETNTGATKL